ncbi:bifunctional UDP-sugar hydrolase/5'-nucleotidase [Bacillus sp. FJAT-47783]|uniref:bifunctional metallophosphatase/5'-nucleotidase n=1 Tax=Bacillus sp. FJAT-47783 TaxID=2922712 RepID=UPI001FAE1C3B|nr:bifunctional UDP-sugar hydrolase/5'-nucleotidase [Bacillus sp. FJAT-47783]
MFQTIHIYHTNDLHSHFENWPQIATYLKKQRLDNLENGDECYLFDIGDHVDRFHPLTESTSGKANIELLNQLKYDAVTIGNNEGITLSHEDLDGLYDEAVFPVIVSNLYDKDGNRPKWVKPYHILETNSGLKIAVLGVTVYYEKFYELLEWKITNPFESVKSVLDEIRDEADLIILMSHLGISDDEWMAETFPEIDIILGGHTHHVLPHGKRINDCTLACAGKYGQWVGHIEISIQQKTKKIHQVQVELIETNELHQDENTVQWLTKATNIAENVLNEVVVQLDEPLIVDWFADSSFVKLLATGLKEWCQGEIAMVNAGVLLESLPKGGVTKGDIHRICPHPINPCLVKIKGDQLKEVILQARTKTMEQFKLKGLGFRGKIMGRMVFDGVEIDAKRLEDGEEHIQHIRINGQPIDLDRVYCVATIDMFTLGPLYPEISHISEKTYFMPEMLRDVLEWKLKQMSRL